MGESVNRHHSIITRLTLMVTGIWVAAVLVVGSLALLGQYRQLHQALATKAATLVQFMAQVTPLDILSLNFVEMNNNVTKVVLTDHEAVYAILLNEQGIPLVHFFKDADPSVTSEVRDLVKNRKPLAAMEAMKRTGRILEVTAPITAGEKRIGSATLGFSTEKMLRALLSQIMLIGAILVAIIGLSIALLRVVLRRILHPVQALTAAATQIRTGDLNVVLSGTDRTDELGVLSRAFESMAGQLRGLIAGLEQREYDLHRLTLFQRTLLDNVAYGIISAASDGVVSSFNPVAERLLGYTAGEVVGKLTPVLWHDPEEIARRAHQLSGELGEAIPPGFEVFAARPRRDLPEENEWTFIRKDGTRVPVLLSVTALRDESGRITGFVGLTYDLTERKSAEAALQAKTEELDRYFTNALDLLCIADTDGHFRRLNLAWESALGYPISELQGRNFLDFIHPEDVEATRQWPFRLDGQNEMSTFTNRYRRKDGAYRWLEWRSYVSGKRIYAVARDITELKLAEQQRLENLRFLESMDQVNRTIQGTSDLDQMMGDVLDTALSHFRCDRAYLLQLSDPENAYWAAPVEKARPEYPGLFTLGMDMSTDPETAKAFRILFEASRPVRFEPESTYVMPPETEKRFGFKSSIAMVLYPKVGKPWEFGLQQSSYPRIWTEEEERLFQEIGRRLTDGLTSVLANHDLRESEDELRRLNKELDLRVRERTSELEEKNAELERMNRLFVGRELRMVELKERIKKLEEGQA